MATVLFVVRANVSAERDDAFNRWYNTEHIPQVLQYRGTVSARRYKSIIGDERFRYMTLYEFESEETFRKFLDSEHLKELIGEYDANFGEVSERERSGYVQVWP